MWYRTKLVWENDCFKDRNNPCQCLPTPSQRWKVAWYFFCVKHIAHGSMDCLGLLLRLYKKEAKDPDCNFKFFVFRRSKKNWKGGGGGTGHCFIFCPSVCLPVCVSVRQVAPQRRQEINGHQIGISDFYLPGCFQFSDTTPFIYGIFLHLALL